MAYRLGCGSGGTESLKPHFHLILSPPFPGDLENFPEKFLCFRGDPESLPGKLLYFPYIPENLPEKFLHFQGNPANVPASSEAFQSLLEISQAF
jgi:hypothetical protein